MASRQKRQMSTLGMYKSTVTSNSFCLSLFSCFLFSFSLPVTFSAIQSKCHNTAIPHAFNHIEILPLNFNSKIQNSNWPNLVQWPPEPSIVDGVRGEGSQRISCEPSRHSKSYLSQGLIIHFLYFICLF